MNVHSELDTPFSQPGSVATDWTRVQQILADADTCWLTTVRGDGRPHVTPLVAVWHDDAMYFCTGETEQKAVNLRTNVEVVLTTGCNGWQEGIDVVVEGSARQVTDDALLADLAALWATKWDGSWQFVVRHGAFEHGTGADDGGGGGGGEDEGGGEGHGRALVFAITIAKVLSFDKGGGAATRHRPAGRVG